MKKPPLVSIVLLCYNQSAFVTEALDSVVGQSYTNWELIIVDDHSTDNSCPTISNYLINNTLKANFFSLEVNLGNCKAFNLGLLHCKGKYIVDLAADDVLMPDRLAKQVAAFEQLPSNYGVIFTDALLLDKSSQQIGSFYPKNAVGQLIHPIPSGDIYRQLVGKQLISSPTMLIKKKVFDALGGYDESLSYEDYDFWVRSSRQFHYHFIPECLTAKRILKNSHRQSFYQKGKNRHLESTLRVCQKAAELNQNKAEDHSLASSVRYHFRLSVHLDNPKVALKFWALLSQLQQKKTIDYVYRILLPLSPFITILFEKYHLLRSNTQRGDWQSSNT